MTTQTSKSWLTTMAERRCVWALLYLIVTGICYYPAVNGNFFFDDEHFILKNEMVHSLDRSADIYTSTVTQGAAIKGNFYRPNQQFTFALIYSLVGDSTPVPYHLVSILLHTLNAALFQHWMLLLGVLPVAAGAAALLWLVHPVHTEAVSYISGLSDPMVLCFMLLGLVIYKKTLNRQAVPERLTTSACVVFGCLALALLTKENAVVFAPLILGTSIYAASLHRRHIQPNEKWILLGVTVMTGFYLILKMTLLNFNTEGLGLSGQVNEYTESLTTRLITFISVLWDYAVLIVFPRDLYYEKPYTAYQSLMSWRGAFGVAALALAGLGLARYQRSPLVALGIFILLSGLLPYVGVIPLNAMYLEHWLYVPLLGVMILVAALWKTISARWGAVLLALVVSAAMTRTYSRNLEWADIETFYLNELAHGGSSTRIFNNLGMHYDDVGNTAKAIEYYQKAVGASADYPLPQPHHNLARSYAKAGRWNDAIIEVRKALAVDPKFIYSLGLLHELCMAAKDEPRARLVEEAFRAVKGGGSYDVAVFNAAVFGPSADQSQN